MLIAAAVVVSASGGAASAGESRIPIYSYYYTTLPPGSYYVAEDFLPTITLGFPTFEGWTIDLNGHTVSGVEVIGKNNIVIRNGILDGYGVYVEASQNVLLEDVVIRGNVIVTGGASGIVLRGVTVSNGYVEFDNVYDGELTDLVIHSGVGGSYGGVLTLANSSDLRGRNIDVTSLATTPFMLDTCDRCEIRDSRFVGESATVNFCSDVVISGNRLPDIHVGDNTNLEISNNQIFAGYYDAVEINGTSPGTVVSGNHIFSAASGVLAWASDVVVVGNVITEPLDYGVFIAADRVVVMDNVVTRTGWIGIGVSGDGATVIRNQLVHGSSGSGIETSGNGGTYLENVVLGCGGYGLEFGSGTTGNLYRDNTSTNCSYPGIYDAGSNEPPGGTFVSDPLNNVTAF